MLTQDAKRIKETLKSGKDLDARDWKMLLHSNSDIMPTYYEERVDLDTGEIKQFKKIDYGIPKDEALKLLKKNGRI